MEDDENQLFVEGIEDSVQESEMSIQIQTHLHLLNQKYLHDDFLKGKLQSLSLQYHSYLENYYIHYDEDKCLVKPLPTILKNERRKLRSYFCIFAALNEFQQPVDPYFLADQIELPRKKITIAFKQNPYSLFIQPHELLPFYLQEQFIRFLPLSPSVEASFQEDKRRRYDVFLERAKNILDLLHNSEEGKEYCNNQSCRNTVLGVICYVAFFPDSPKRKAFTAYSLACNIKPASLMKLYDDCCQIIEEIERRKKEGEEIKEKYTFWWID